MLGVTVIGFSGDPTRDRITFGPSSTDGSFAGYPMSLVLAGTAVDRAVVREYVSSRLPRVILKEVSGEAVAMELMKEVCLRLTTEMHTD